METGELKRLTEHTPTHRDKSSPSRRKDRGGDRTERRHRRERTGEPREPRVDGDHSRDERTERYERPERHERPESDLHESSRRDDRRDDRREEKRDDRRDEAPRGDAPRGEYSFTRLMKFLAEKGYVTERRYSIRDEYRFLHVISTIDACEILLDIGTKYKFRPLKDKYDLELLPKDSRELTSDLTRSHNESELRSIYREIDHLDQYLQTEEQATNGYRKPISLVGEGKKSQDKMASTCRQLSRFKLCLTNLPYRLAMIDDECLCVSSGDVIESFFIQSFRTRKRKLIVVVSLELFGQSTSIGESVRTLLDQFYDILDNNQKVQTGKIQKMIDNKRDIVVTSNNIINRKSILTSQIDQAEKILEECNRREKAVYKEKSTVKDPKRISELGDEMKKLEHLKADTIKKILELRESYNEMTLMVDNVLFDNMIMLMNIGNNFKTLEKVESGATS